MLRRRLHMDARLHAFQQRSQARGFLPQPGEQALYLFDNGIGMLVVLDEDPHIFVGGPVEIVERRFVGRIKEGIACVLGCQLQRKWFAPGREC